MGLLQEIRDESNKRSGICKFGKLLETLSKSDRAEIEEALTDHNVSVNAIVKVLNVHGYKVGTTVAHKHKVKECCCVNQ